MVQSRISANTRTNSFFRSSQADKGWRICCSLTCSFRTSYSPRIQISRALGAALPEQSRQFLIWHCRKEKPRQSKRRSRALSDSFSMRIAVQPAARSRSTCVGTSVCRWDACIAHRRHCILMFKMYTIHLDGGVSRVTRYMACTCSGCQSGVLCRPSPLKPKPANKIATHARTVMRLRRTGVSPIETG